MCGISGVVVPPTEAIDTRVVRQMTQTLHRRGPDDEGYYFDAAGGCALGHRRLSIIDLSGGHQPMATVDGRIHAVVNGEIYNFVELREHLEDRGHVFRTKSDSEVVLHGFAEWGEKVFERIDGMFAVALWDARERRLCLARDRIGKKPLYYAFVGPKNETLIFGSELSALIVHPLLTRRVDSHALANYLVYECCPEDQALYEGVRKLLPGTYLAYDRESCRAKLSLFWELNYRNVAGDDTHVSHGSFDEVADHIRHLIRRAVRRRLVSDVPLGVFLSGGIDSSTVAAAMTEIMPQGAVKSFSITFDEPSFDEGPYARRVAEVLGTDHREEHLSASTMLSIWPHVASLMSEPIGDASIIPTYLLSRFARETVTVALGGDGGDELFLGYPTFVADRVARRLDAIVPRNLLDSAARSLTTWIHLLPASERNMGLDFVAKRFLSGLGRAEDVRHQVWMGSFVADDLPNILSDEFADHALTEHPYSIVTSYRGRANMRDAYDAQAYQYLRLYLTGCVLVKVDRASMANSLEVRSPLLDTELVEFVSSVPGRLKLRRSTTKALLKHAVRPWLPNDIIHRKKKGFGMPVAKWLRGPLREMAHDLLAPDRLRRQGYFNAEAIARILDEHDRGRADHRKPLWTLLAFQAWFDHFGPTSGFDRRSDETHTGANLRVRATPAS